jgi:hypothetical protein
MLKPTLEVLYDTFVIHSLPNNAQIPASVFFTPFYFIGKTHD